jgi:hypothetical protein
MKHHDWRCRARSWLKVKRRRFDRVYGRHRP